MTTPTPEPVTGNEDFAEVYATATGRKQTVPRHFLTDPVLSRGIRKTPSQRELDGDLGPRPTQESKVPEIDRYADAAGIEFDSGADKSAKLTAIDQAFAHADVQDGMAEVPPDPAVVDPLAPELVAAVTDPATPVTTTVLDTTSATEPGTSEPATNDHTPAAGDEEN